MNSGKRIGLIAVRIHMGCSDPIYMYIDVDFDESCVLVLIQPLARAQYGVSYTYILVVQGNVIEPVISFPFIIQYSILLLLHTMCLGKMLSVHHIM